MNSMDQRTNAGDDGSLCKTYSAEELLRPGEAQRNSDEFSRQILESSRDCIKMLDLDGRCCG
jgi:hypothetical protein